MSMPLIQAILLSGKWGSGKSYYAVLKILEALMCGRVVVTNIALEWTECEKYAKRRGVVLERDNYRYFTLQEVDANIDAVISLMCDGCVLVIDEVHLILDARNWQANEKKSSGLQVFMTQGRKFSISVYLIAQSDGRVDSRMKDQVAWTYRCVNWLSMPVLGKLLPIPATLIRECQGSTTEQTAKRWIVRSREVYRCYNTKQVHMGLALTGAPPKPVQGKRSERAGFGMRIAMTGACCLAADWWMNRKPAAAATVSSAPASGSPPVAAPAAHARALTDEDYTSVLWKIEGQLPLVRMINDRGVHLMNGACLYYGSAFVSGRVESWTDCGDTVYVRTSNPVFPIITLFKSDASRSLQFNAIGDPLRLDPRRSDLGGRADGPGNLAVPPVVENSAAQIILGAAYAPPQAYIPPVNPGYRAVLPSGPDPLASDRIGAPAPASGFMPSGWSGPR